MPFMPTAYDAINRLEMDAKLEYPHSKLYPITFDNGRPLLIIAKIHRQPDLVAGFVYRRGGLNLTRDQATELIHREQQHASKTQ